MMGQGACVSCFYWQHLPRSSLKYLRKAPATTTCSFSRSLHVHWTTVATQCSSTSRRRCRITTFPGSAW